MKIKISLNSRLQLLAIVILGSMLVAAGGYFYYQFEKKSLRTEKHAELSAIARLKVNQLTRWQEERLSEAVFFTKNYPFSEYALGIIDGNDHYKDLLKSSLTHIMTNNRYENILILSQEGKMFFSVNPVDIQLDSATINSLKNVFQTGEIDISDFYPCKIHNSIHYEVVAPIIKDGKTFAVLVFRMDPANYLFPLIEEWPTPSRTAETLIVKREGDSVVFINNLRHIENVNLSFKLPITSTEVSAVNAVLGYEGLFEGKDYRGNSVLSDISRVPNTNWYMISEIDQDEIYSAIYTRAVFIAIIVFITMLLLGLGVVWIYYYRQRNIYRKLIESKKELHQSHEEYRATIYSIGDGVITTDKKGIVKQLNPVAEKLTGWSENEANGKTLEEVFKIVNEDSRRSVESPVSKVLNEGLVIGLANHTLLISKDGTEIPIADSGAPIKDEMGEIVGVVMVFRDQTEERVNEKTLRESEERFKALHNASFGGIVIHDKGLILECNQGLADITGYSYDELIGMDGLLLIAEESRGIVKKMILEGYEKPYEAFGLRKNGEKYPVRLEARNVPYKGKMVRTTEFRDISVIKKAEEALKKIEWMLTSEPDSQSRYDDTVTNEQSYGDLTILNENGLIKSSIDKTILKGIVSEYMNLLETSSAIYEKDGDYAYGIFSSNWCQLMDQASRNLCNTEDNSEALVSGKWLCHESCWKDCSTKAIESQMPADIECNGGIRLYGVPIFASGQVIGAINFGYGDPPKEETKLKELAKDYNIPVKELLNEASEYDSRPAFIIEMAKKRIEVSARLIGTLVERKQAEISLIENEEKYKSLFNSIRDAILVADTNRVITQCNPAFHDLFGYSQEEIVGKETSFIYKDKEEFLMMGQRIKESSKTNNFLFTVFYKKKNGEVFSGETNVFYLKNANNETIGVIGMIRDVTEREKAEDAIRNSEKQFRQLVDNAPQGIYVQTNRRFAYLNPVAIKLFGAESHEELIGEPVIDRFHPDFHELVKQRIEQLNNEQKEVPSIVEVCLKMDETPFDVEVSAAPINYQGENGALVFFHDITERKKANKELIELKNELEQKVIEKTKELSDRIAELERFREATINRELRMKELRDELQRLKRE